VVDSSEQLRTLDDLGSHFREWLDRISPEAVKDPKNFKDLAKTVSETIKQQCPGVIWKDSYATLGRFDVVDIVEAAKPEEVQKAAVIIRSSVQTARGATVENNAHGSAPRPSGSSAFSRCLREKGLDLRLQFSAFATGALTPLFVVLADCHCEGETLNTLFANIFVKRHRNPPLELLWRRNLKHYSVAMTIFNLQA
jgi:uncharacterized protein with GYD domain